MKSPDGTNSDRVQPEGSAEEPVPGTSETYLSGLGKVEKPRRYRAVSKEAGTSPGGEVIYKNFLEAVDGAVIDR